MRKVSLELFYTILYVCFQMEILYSALYIIILTCMYVSRFCNALARHYSGLYPDPFRLGKINIRPSNYHSAAYFLVWFLKSRYQLNFFFSFRCVSSYSVP